MPAATPRGTTVEQGGATGLSALHPDIIKSHVLSRLDGPGLGSAACCSSFLRQLSSQDELWSNICHSTWPSTCSPRLSDFISTFPGGGPRAFFSHAFPIWADRIFRTRSSSSPPPSELISAVDIYHKGKLIFAKTQETETVSGWFRCSPFRIDLLDPKDVVPTPVKHPEGDEACTELIDDMTLSWILIDPNGGRVVNLSSQKPVTVQRHWLTGEVQVRYASIIAGDHGRVQCGIVVSCGGSENGGMEVREVSLEIEDMDGTHLNGKDSLVFLQGSLEGKKGTGKNRVQEGQRRYNEYVEMKRLRKERKLRAEGALDMLCVAIGVSTLAAFCCFLFWR